MSKMAEELLKRLYEDVTNLFNEKELSPIQSTIGRVRRHVEGGELDWSKWEL